MNFFAATKNLFFIFICISILKFINGIKSQYKFITKTISRCLLKKKFYFFAKNIRFLSQKKIFSTKSFFYTFFCLLFNKRYEFYCISNCPKTIFYSCFCILHFSDYKTVKINKKRTQIQYNRCKIL